MSGNIRPQLSQVAKPLWTDLDTKSGISVRELISTLKKKIKKKRRPGTMVAHSPQVLAREEKDTTTNVDTVEDGSQNVHRHEKDAEVLEENYVSSETERKGGGGGEG